MFSLFNSNSIFVGADVSNWNFHLMKYLKNIGAFTHPRWGVGGENGWNDDIKIMRSIKETYSNTMAGIHKIFCKKVIKGRKEGW